MSKPLDFVTNELNEARAKNLFRPLKIVSGMQGARTVIDGREVINLSSNNYLGLTKHPKVIEAALKAVREIGAGAGAVRTIIGTLELHDRLEKKIAQWKNVEAALVFQSGFCANQGTIVALVGRDDLIYSDQLSHASIIDGCRLSRAKIEVYEHSNVDSLRELCQRHHDRDCKKLLVTDSVFSMDGDIAPLPAIAEIAAEYGLITFVDDAHASGVLGEAGRGSVDHFGLHGKIDMVMGTLSKAIGVMGGYIVGSRDLIDYLIMRSRPMLFSTATPPAVPAATIAAIEVMETEPQHQQRLWSNVEFFRGELRTLGFDCGNPETPITPVIVGDESLANTFSDELYAQGVFAQGIIFPTVPRGTGRVRTIMTSMHSREDLEQALETFAKVGKQLSII
ncbi:MAG: glycine C-acetyltransferase [Candidatus Alcyoniella australis]|nr:glycine C-acetyltransferase [Candidatus Alcyoniella australis]